MQFNFDDLIERGLVKEKEYPNGLSVFKYARKVFYDGLWNLDSRLLDARGLVLDSQGQAVVWPFTKVFNHQENGTTCDTDKDVVAVRKVNGFMMSVGSYQGDLVYSSTGTLDSDYVKLGKSVIESQVNMQVLKGLTKAFTLIFEITDPSDPHIVEEDYDGAWLIGMREMFGGDMLSEWVLDQYGVKLDAYRPEHVHVKFSQALRFLADCRHEGFMIREDTTDQRTIMKMKSPYYLTKKFLMRMGERKAEAIWAGNTRWKEWIDEEFYAVVDHVVTNYTKDQWKLLDEQGRGKLIEEYFNANIVLD